MSGLLVSSGFCGTSSAHRGAGGCSNAAAPSRGSSALRCLPMGPGAIALVMACMTRGAALGLAGRAL
eukprot:538190-Alexandrium_andersonii.AAC.1